MLKGELLLKGRRVDSRNIHQPMCVVAASKDHIVPPMAAEAAKAGIHVDSIIIQ